MTLSAYIDFSVKLNLVTNRVEVTDISTYPAGVASGITGIITITQPDKITVNGDFNSPDITYVGGALTVSSKELRKRTDGYAQQGDYTIVYTVDHPSYSPTTLTKTFTLSYKGVTPAIEESFDVFTPLLKASDATDYSKSGFNAPTIVRAWSAQVGTVGTVTGTSSLLDLKYSGNYYDAAYAISLTTTLTYVHSTYTYLTVYDQRTGTLDTTANTPPSYTTMVGYLNEIKDKYDNLTVCSTRDARDDYQYAQSLLSHIKLRICSGDTTNLYPQLQDFLNIYYGVSVAYVNTNVVIPAYSLADVDCGTGTDGRITNTDISNWNTAYGAIPPDDLEYIVGTTTGAPTNGSATFVLPALANRRIRLIINKIPYSKLDWNGNPYFSKPLASDTLTLNGTTFTTTDLVQIQFY